MIKVHSIEQQQGNLIAVADMPGEDGLTIIIPVEAIGDRMVLYDLRDPHAALEAILHEHYVRLHPDLDSPVSHEELRSSFADQPVAVHGVTEKRQKLVEDNVYAIRDVVIRRLRAREEV